MSERERFEAAFPEAWSSWNEATQQYLGTVWPTAWAVWQAARSGQAASGSQENARSDRTPSQKLADAGFTRRPSLWALQARETLELIAAPQRADGSWNRDREACRQLAAEALGRDTDSDVQNGVGQPEAPTAAPLVPLAWAFKFNNGQTARTTDAEEAAEIRRHLDANESESVEYGHPPARSGAGSEEGQG